MKFSSNSATAENETDRKALEKMALLLCLSGHGDETFCYDEEVGKLTVLRGAADGLV